MDKSTVYELVKSATGLDYFKVGTSGIDRAVNLRRVNTNNETVDEYIACLEKSGGDELALLIEEIIVSETWFFRDQTPFDFLSHYVTNDWLNKRGERRLNVLSFPCSTGEEAYSIAMVLKQIGLPTDLINIDAYDISSRSIEVARRGVYRENSFRGDDGKEHRDLFSHQGGLYYLNEEIREMVNFRQGNILDAESLLGGKNYDIIFCRNLLIYLDKDTQLRVCESLLSSLLVGGAFFVGHAEVNSVARLSGLQQVTQHGAFAFVKAEDEKAVTSDKKEDKASAVSGRPANSDGTVVNRLLHQAEQLIEVGDLAAARYLCESIVEMSPLSSRGFYLLAIIATKKEDWLAAQTLFHKVLYLDSAHIEALQQLLECARQLGDEEQCTSLGQRLSRMRSRLAS